MDAKPTTKKTLQNVLADIGDRKLILVSGASKLQDSRYLVHEANADHVVIKMLGEELLVIPFSAITSLKLERSQLTINYR
jgi:hypothetical protein